ncbi:hypothetical protein EDB85DRAFT_1891176 [Lactarius pseudohatsudake]|nr:hypothetical protein EDB85DRAFT_1891176 [Lactarius pseudohatsudake]
MSSFLLTMTAYPTVQCKCQAELDVVIGNNHLPMHFMHNPEVYKDPMVFNLGCLVALPGRLAKPDLFNFVMLVIEAHTIWDGSRVAQYITLSGLGVQICIQTCSRHIGASPFGFTNLGKNKKKKISRVPNDQKWTK